jgi:hypothetical protein
MRVEFDTEDSTPLYLLHFDKSMSVEEVISEIDLYKFDFTNDDDFGVEYNLIHYANIAVMSRIENLQEELERTEILKSRLDTAHFELKRLHESHLKFKNEEDKI